MRLTVDDTCLPSPDVSIHAPVKDATQNHLIEIPKIWVSIHAPVKDATCRISLGIIQGMRFNPRTRKGCDDRSAGYPKIVDKFQSTHP